MITFWVSDLSSEQTNNEENMTSTKARMSLETWKKVGKFVGKTPNFPFPKFTTSPFNSYVSHVINEYCPNFYTFVLFLILINSKNFNTNKKNKFLKTNKIFLKFENVRKKLKNETKKRLSKEKNEC